LISLMLTPEFAGFNRVFTNRVPAPVRFDFEQA
jgi:hypothetical protein